MSASRAAGWPLGAPTAAQLKEFFAQIESRRITKDRLQSFLRSTSGDRYQLLRDVGVEGLSTRLTPDKLVNLFELCKLFDLKIDLIHEIANHREMERQWEVEEASGSWGGQLVGPEMRATHRHDAEELIVELSDTNTKIDDLVSALGLDVESN